jgi:ABC-2 type transport system ATP-binding protein
MTLSSANVISLRAVSRSFGRHQVVHDVTFDVAEGEIVGFLGENGAGKTTTIRMILGLLAASSGEIRLLGRRVPGELSALPDVGYLEERPSFYPWLSARANLRVLLEPVGISTSAIDDAIERVGLADRAGGRVRSFSNGMRTRLGLARALAGLPRAVILDEPTNGLDPAWIREFRRIVREVAGTGCGVLLSSHQLAEVEKVADRVVVLADGSVVADRLLGQHANTTGWFVVDLSESDRDRAKAALAEFETIQTDHGLRVRASKGTSISRALTAAGVVIDRLQPEKESLEATFFPEVGGDET